MSAADASCATSGLPSTRATPRAAQAEAGWRLRRPVPDASKPAGSFTSNPHGSPGRQPARCRKLAVEASASGTLSTRSRRPSPSKSTASAHERRRHELRVAEGAGPGALELLRRDVAVLDDLETCEEFAAEVGLAAPVAGQGRQRLEQRPLAEVASEVALDAPDRDDRRRVDAVTRFDLLQHVAPAGEHLAAVGHPLLVDQAREVVPDRRDEFRLRVERSR